MVLPLLWMTSQPKLKNTIYHCKYPASSPITGKKNTVKDGQNLPRKISPVRKALLFFYWLDELISSSA